MADAAVLAGISEADFWNLTPAEIERAQWAAVERADRAHKARIIQAWWIVALDRHRHLPALSVLLHPTRILRGEELTRRQAEHEAIVRQFRQG